MLLISSPAKAWEEISVEGDRRKVFTSFVYPMIGLCGLSVFIGSLFEDGINFQLAMTDCCAVFVALFGGYFLAAYIINKVGETIFLLRDNILVTQQFVGYSLVVIFLLDIITGLIPGFFILKWIFQFYVIYVVWEGAKTIIHVHESRRMSYTIFSSILIIACPAIIEFVFNRLTTILN